MTIEEIMDIIENTNDMKTIKVCDELTYMIENYDNPILHSMHRYILDTHDFDEQVKHFYTEVFELTQAIYSNAGRDVIGKELADCYNFLDQIAMYYSLQKPTIYKVQINKSQRTIDEMKGRVMRNEETIQEKE